MLDLVLAALAIAPAPALPCDPEIEAAVAGVSPERLRQSVVRLVAFGTRHTLSETGSDTRGIGAARRWLAEELHAAGGGRIEVELHAFVAEPGPRVPRPVEVVNVLGWLRGTAQDSARRIVVVAAHYDSRARDVLDATSDAPGADDDASGVALVLEVARALAGKPHDATVLFALVAGEEQGLLGSEALAKRLVAEGHDVTAMFTNDIVGASRGGNGLADPGRVRLFSEGVPEGASEAERKAIAAAGGENDSPSRNLARFTVETAERYVPGFTVTHVQRRDRLLRGGDHMPFLRRGIAACRFTEPFEDYAHQHEDVRLEGEIQYGDLVRYLDFDLLARVTRVNVATLAVLARAPAPPRDAVLLALGLSHDSALSWSRGTEPDLHGYRILVRSTTSDRWEQAIEAGDVTTFSIAGLSKDDVIYGLVAVDRDGHASPAAFPWPKR